MEFVARGHCTYTSANMQPAKSEILRQLRGIERFAIDMNEPADDKVPSHRFFPGRIPQNQLATHALRRSGESHL